MSLDADHLARRSRRSRTLLSCAAAAAIVLGAGLAAAVASGRHQAIPAATRLGQLCPSPRGTPGPGGTWCAVLYLGAGRLTRAAGPTLTLVSARGVTSTVTTSAATVFLRLQAGNPGDITDGARARVTVASSGGALTATTVMVPPDVVVTGTDSGADKILGVVADASADGFTLVESDGRRAQVTVTPATTVITPVHIGESQLWLGVATIATGVPGAGGAMAASTVEQFPVPAVIPALYASG